MPNATQPAPVVRVKWLADESRIAHAHLPRQPRSLCGEPAVDERLAWPQIRNCRGCELLVAERQGQLPLAENEARGAWGDR